MKSRLIGPNGEKRHYDTITFQHGYQPNSDRVVTEFKGFYTGAGVKHWGAEPGITYYVIKIGKILEK